MQCSYAFVLEVHSERLFSRESLERLDQLTRRVAAPPHVTRVLSPTNVRDLEGDAMGPVPVVPYAGGAGWHAPA